MGKSTLDLNTFAETGLIYPAEMERWETAHRIESYSFPTFSKISRGGGEENWEKVYQPCVRVQHGRGVAFDGHWGKGKTAKQWKQIKGTSIKMEINRYSNVV